MIIKDWFSTFPCAIHLQSSHAHVPLDCCLDPAGAHTALELKDLTYHKRFVFCFDSQKL